MEDLDVRGRFSTIDMLLVSVVIFWGLNYVIVKVSLKEMEPLLFNTLRFTIGAAVCWVILLMKEKDIKISKKQFWQLMLTGVVANGINQIAFIYGVGKTTAGATSIILASTPGCVAFLASVLKLEKASMKTWIGIIISFAGVAFVVLGSGSLTGGGAESTWGNLLIVVATIFWSIYTILLRFLFKDVSTIKVTTYAMTFTTLFFLMITSKQILQCDWRAFSGTAWGGVFFSGVFVIGISYALWNVGIQKVGPTKTSIYANLPPFVSVLVGWLLLGETITSIQIIGGALIIMGLVYARKAREKFR
ncbi:MAG: DMT family transporter [Bacillota bacterium]